MANRHFGSIADVWKHAVLVEVLEREPPAHYAETHAGSGAYPLAHDGERGVRHSALPGGGRALPAASPIALSRNHRFLRRERPRRVSGLGSAGDDRTWRCQLVPAV